MQYIPLADFFGFLGKTVQAVAAEEKPVFAAELAQLYASGKTIRTEGKPVSLDEAVAFLDLLSHPGIVVFDQWIMQFSGLKNFLSGGTLSSNNFDPKIVLEHRLFPDFSKFVTRFLLPEMMRKLSEANDPDFMLIGSYVNLLDHDGKLIAQDKMDAWLKNKLSFSLAAAQKATTERELAKTIDFVISDEVIAFVNQFNKAFYATKIAYIDSMLEVTKFPACTQRLGSWISAQLKKLSLNPEHLEKIEEITETVKSGKARFSNQNGKVSVSIGSVRMLSLLAAVILGVVFYFMWFFSFEEETPQIADQKSSFEQFTKEERMQLDSLIKGMTPQPGAVTDSSTGYDRFLHLPPADMNVLFREPYANRIAEQFHQDCMKDQLLLESGQIDTCMAYPADKFKSRIPQNFKRLSNNPGFQPVFLVNETVYQVLVLVFKDETNAPVYAALMGEGDQLNFKMSAGERILFLPGNDWSAFHTTADAEIPSKDFKYHFCLQDEHFKAMLFSPYALKPVSKKLVKLMLNESPQTDTGFFLIDLYEALEPVK